MEDGVEKDRARSLGAWRSSGRRELQRQRALDCGKLDGDVGQGRRGAALLGRGKSGLSCAGATYLSRTGSGGGDGAAAGRDQNKPPGEIERRGQIDEGLGDGEKNQCGARDGP
jgi:hypothetical protein